MVQTLAQRFGRRVRLLRLKRGWRQVDLAAHAELSRQHISKIEIGASEACMTSIGRLAEALEVEPVELFRFPVLKK